MQVERENKRGLPGFPFPESLTVYADLGDALKDSGLVLVVTSVAGLRSSAELLKQHNADHIPVLLPAKATKRQDTGLLTFQVKEVLPENKKIGVLSGRALPELAKQLPCTPWFVASENQEWIEELVRNSTGINAPLRQHGRYRRGCRRCRQKRYGNCHRSFRRVSNTDSMRVQRW